MNNVLKRTVGLRDSLHSRRVNASTFRSADHSSSKMPENRPGKMTDPGRERYDSFDEEEKSHIVMSNQTNTIQLQNPHHTYPISTQVPDETSVDEIPKDLTYYRKQLHSMQSKMKHELECLSEAEPTHRPGELQAALKYLKPAIQIAERAVAYASIPFGADLHQGLLENKLATLSRVTRKIQRRWIVYKQLTKHQLPINEANLEAANLLCLLQDPDLNLKKLRSYAEKLQDYLPKSKPMSLGIGGGKDVAYHSLACFIIQNKATLSNWRAFARNIHDQNFDRYLLQELIERIPPFHVFSRRNECTYRNYASKSSKEKRGIEKRGRAERRCLHKMAHDYRRVIEATDILKYVHEKLQKGKVNFWFAYLNNVKRGKANEINCINEQIFSAVWDIGTELQTAAKKPLLESTVDLVSTKYDDLHEITKLVVKKAVFTPDEAPDLNGLEKPRARRWRRISERFKRVPSVDEIESLAQGARPQRVQRSPLGIKLNNTNQDIQSIPSRHGYAATFKAAFNQVHTEFQTNQTISYKALVNLIYHAECFDAETSLKAGATTYLTKLNGFAKNRAIVQSCRALVQQLQPNDCVERPERPLPYQKLQAIAQVTVLQKAIHDEMLGESRQRPEQVKILRAIGNYRKGVMAYLRDGNPQNLVKLVDLNNILTSEVEKFLNRSGPKRTLGFFRGADNTIRSLVRRLHRVAHAGFLPEVLLAEAQARSAKAAASSSGQSLNLIEL